jgi:glycosyltransferase involved in cell wall biosynthesis
MSVTPRISVVIPALNEAVSIAACLEALKHQRNAPNYQVIVVDNGSTDETAAVARSYGAEVIVEGRRGIARARQTGFRASISPLIATTDADSLVPTTWLATLVSHFEANYGLVGLGGPVTYPFDDPRLRQLMAQLLTNLFLLDQSFHGGKAHLVGANFAVRRTAFEAIGGFRTDLQVGEDTDLTHRLHEEGSVLFVPELVVVTSNRRLKQTGPAAIWHYLRTYLNSTEPSFVLQRRIFQQLRNSQRRLDIRRVARKKST